MYSIELMQANMSSMIYCDIDCLIRVIIEECPLQSFIARIFSKCCAVCDR